MKLLMIITKFKAWILNFRKEREVEVPKYSMVSHHEFMKLMNVDQEFMVELMCKEKD